MTVERFSFNPRIGLPRPNNQRDMSDQCANMRNPSQYVPIINSSQYVPMMNISQNVLNHPTITEKILSPKVDKGKITYFRPKIAQTFLLVRRGAGVDWERIFL